jgi:hypothetical protein
MIAIALIILAVGFYLLACVLYARSSWELNSDLMGASFTFDSCLYIGSVLLCLGLYLRWSIALWLVGLIFIASVVLGKAFQWFFLERLLFILFKSYRKNLP